jgi:hypothetical protein
VDVADAAAVAVDAAGEAAGAAAVAEAAACPGAAVLGVRTDRHLPQKRSAHQLR